MGREVARETAGLEGATTTNVGADIVTFNDAMGLYGGMSLEGSGLVRSRKEGRVRTCRLEPKPLAAAQDWIATRRAFWERQFDALEAWLDDIQQLEWQRGG